MPLRPFILALSAVGVAAFAGCKGGKQAPDAPPAASLMQWGQAQADTAARLEAAGWKAQGAADGGLRLILPEADEPAAEALAALGDDAPPRYELALLGQSEKLQIVVLQRRDSTQRLTAFRQSLLHEFGAGEPIWTAPEKEIAQASGNRLAERTSLYETASAYIALYETRFTAAEARQADDPNSSIEARIYSRQYNEGISREALVAGFEAR
ncbi:MAG: hypothetical protein K1X75_01085 [Leptospirales bacterium]|nr:hypothetical protein [Leptospirales bacterium]